MALVVENARTLQKDRFRTRLQSEVDRQTTFTCDGERGCRSKFQLEQDDLRLVSTWDNGFQMDCPVCHKTTYKHFTPTPEEAARLARNGRIAIATLLLVGFLVGYALYAFIF